MVRFLPDCAAAQESGDSVGLHCFHLEREFLSELVNHSECPSNSAAEGRSWKRFAGLRHGERNTPAHNPEGLEHRRTLLKFVQIAAI